MKSIFTTLLSILFVAGIVSCGGDSQSSSDVQTGNDTTNIVDSTAIIKRQQEEAKTRDSLPQNCSAEQAINYMKTSGYWDKYSSGIIPSIVQQHLPYAQRLINNKYNHFIIVDKGSMHVILYDKYGHLKLSYKMACGRNYGHKRGKADCRTPEGIFQCGGWYDSTDWLYTNDWGVTSRRRGQFGPRFIRVCPQIGIHGTGARYSIENRCSHGCIRIQNENVLELVKYVETGMPIIVNPGPRDKAVNDQNGVKMPMLNIPNIPGDKTQNVVESSTTTKKQDKNSSVKKAQPTKKTTEPQKAKDKTESKQQTPATTPQNETPVKAETPKATVPEASTPKVETPSTPAPNAEPKPEPKPQPKPEPKPVPQPVAPATTE